MALPQESQTDPFLSEEFFTHPEDVIARMRVEDPVHKIPDLNGWMVTRYDDVRRLFTEPNATNDQRVYEHYRPAPEGSKSAWIAENNPFAAPPDQHARMRKLVSAALTPRAVKRMEGQVRDVVEQFAAPLREASGVVDLVAEFTDPIPNTVIGRITGVPPKGEDEARWRELAREALRGISPFLSDEERKKSDAAMLELCDYVGDLAKERRSDPKADLVSDLVLAHDEHDRMTNEEIVLMVAGLVAAGTETTAIGGTRGLRSLLLNPGEMERLRADRSLMPNAVNELLRYDFGSLGLPRYAIRDLDLRGKQIKRGELLLLNFIGAHRDPEVFADPNRLDLSRDTRALTIFGHGPHYCLGANLARQELGCMFDAALGFLPPGIRLLEDRVRWTRMGIFSRIDTLPVALP